MKRAIFLLLCLLSCSSPRVSSEWMGPTDKIRVLATTAMIQDTVAEIGKERVSTNVLIRGEIDPHSYELVKGDDEKLRMADLVVSNGLGLEHGASLRYAIEHHPHALLYGDAIDKDRLLVIDGKYDPHVWMDISLWSEGIDAVVAALSEIDPGSSSYYQENGQALKEKMRAAHEGIYRELHQIPSEKRYLVTSHNAFNYFARAYLSESGEWEKERCEAPEGLAPDGQLSVADIQRIIEHICTYHIGVVFSESNVSKDSLKKIISSTAAKCHPVRICTRPLYGDSMGHDVHNYIEMIEHNGKILKEEWEKE